MCSPYPNNNRRYFGVFPLLLATADDNVGFPCILATADDSLQFFLYPENDPIIVTIPLFSSPYTLLIEK
jgi:hypothetical protein